MRRLDRERLSDLAARTFVGVLFILLSINLLDDFTRTHRLTGLLLLVSESLIVVLTIVRRRALTVDRSAVARIAATLSIAGPPLLRASESGAFVPDYVTAAASAVGLSLAIAAKLSLGRSFGIVPANRGVVATGPYGLVRHPIYTGYLITHIAFLIAHPTMWNVAVVVVADAALVARGLIEERMLARDERYREYCSRVGWHMVPGVF
jgi:protein-S-isoprenylcysteine O-methyltransferase Ste14